MVGELMSHSTGPGGTACRYGGEEFAVVLPGATLPLARDTAEAIRNAVSGLRPTGASSPVVVTISGGLTCTDEWDKRCAITAAEMLEATDRALYVAKSTGRNRIVTFTPSDVAARRRTAQPRPPLDNDEPRQLGAED
jgi:diguanylate cyclase (GGDEF)-like protein